MSWDVEYTNEFFEWWNGLEDPDQDAIIATVELLSEYGPGLRRPIVGTISGSRHRNMKELIPPAGNIRILFAFDPRRTAILLLGGDKTKQWKHWYATFVPTADDLYDQYLSELRDEGILP